MAVFDDERHSDGPRFEFLVFEGTPAARGELDRASVPDLERWLASIEGQRDAVDLSEVTFFNASALRVLLKWRRHDPRLRIVQLSEAVARVLTITDTADYLVGTTSDGDRPTRPTAKPTTEVQLVRRRLARSLIECGRRVDEGEMLTGDQGDEIIRAINLWRLFVERDRIGSNSE